MQFVWRRLHKELESDKIMGMPSNEKLSKYSFLKQNKVTIPDEKAWTGRSAIHAKFTTPRLQNL